jgi:hypothetical protein
LGGERGRGAKGGRVLKDEEESRYNILIIIKLIYYNIETSD